jgi:hypothetical protein
VHTTALVELDDGRIAIGVGPRILVHTPSRERLQAPPVPVFTAHRVGDVAVLGSPESLILEPDRKALMLELGGIGVMPGEVPLFRYRVLPTDTGWKEIGAAKRIDLFDLDPGLHRIVVQIGRDGVHWGPMEASVTVEVLPPRSTPPGGSVRSSFSRSLRWPSLASRPICTHGCDCNGKRSSASRRCWPSACGSPGICTTTLGAGLSALKLRSEMALRVEQDPAKREHLRSLARTAGELIGSMRQIIWAMNADQTELADLVAYTTNHAAAIAMSMASAFGWRWRRTCRCER